MKAIILNPMYLVATAEPDMIFVGVFDVRDDAEAFAVLGRSSRDPR